MPRPERPLDPNTGPLHAFAAELRLIREKAGNPKYLQMARATGRSRTALAEAAGGDHLATWETVEAYLTACGEKPASWRDHWESVRREIDVARHVGASPLNVETHPGPSRPPSESRLLGRRGRLIAVGAAASVLIIVIAIGYLAHYNAPHDPHHRNIHGIKAGTILIVQNKVAVGATGFYEDITPSYLSTRTEPECADYHCEIPDTTMWSGAKLYALCQVHGAVMTNEDLSSPGIGHNPEGVTSSLWFRAQMPYGAIGYISQAYLTRASRGGLGLPKCRADDGKSNFAQSRLFSLGTGTNSVLLEG
jgi:helix-turn-helix protein